MPIAPEPVEAFLQLPSSTRGQLAPKQTLELLPRTPSHCSTTAQQLPAHAFQLFGLGFAGLPQTESFPATFFIDRLIQMLGDVEAIEHMQRLIRLLGDDLQVGPPHV